MKKYPKTSFRDWTRRFRTERECLEAVARARWRKGFQCPRCGHEKAYVLKRHCIRQCASCAYQASPTAGTLFENTRLRIRTDGWRAYGTLSLEEGIEVESQATPPSKVDEWLPKVHTAIANLKRFLLWTLHGVSSPKLQMYLDEFVYRYNRRFWEPQLPHRLLTVCANHLPSPAKILYGKPLLS
ncbi:MAG: IS1595 family transposase [Gammaproteobacteria bacterium]|nr:IS1595 family transposase [Gammaproteobacteria bacterium]